MPEKKSDRNGRKPDSQDRDMMDSNTDKKSNGDAQDRGREARATENPLYPDEVDSVAGETGKSADDKTGDDGAGNDQPVDRGAGNDKPAAPRTPTCRKSRRPGESPPWL